MLDSFAPVQSTAPGQQTGAHGSHSWVSKPVAVDSTVHASAQKHTQKQEINPEVDVNDRRFDYSHFEFSYDRELNMIISRLIDNFTGSTMLQVPSPEQVAYAEQLKRRDIKQIDARI